MANNKVQLADGTVLVDLTKDSVTPQTLLSGATAHNAAGERIAGAVVTAPASTTTPKALGKANAGSENAYARGDHVHPTDTTRQPKITANGILKGDGAGGVSGGTVGKSELADAVQKSLDKADASVPTTGGTMTGPLKVGSASLSPNGYVQGTWLQTTANNHLANKATKVAILDGSGWVYHRTLAEFKIDLGLDVAFTVTLPASGWRNNAQTIGNAKFVASGYAYTVSPEGGSFLACNAAIIYVDNVTEAGKMTFHCVETPTEDLTMNILRTEVSA